MARQDEAQAVERGTRGEDDLGREQAVDEDVLAAVEAAGVARSSHVVKKVADRDGMLIACDGADGSGGGAAAGRFFFLLALGDGAGIFLLALGDGAGREEGVAHGVGTQ